MPLKMREGSFAQKLTGREKERLELQKHFQRRVQTLADRHGQTEVPQINILPEHSRGYPFGYYDPETLQIGMASKADYKGAILPKLENLFGGFERKKFEETFAHETMHWMVRQGIVSPEEYENLRRVAAKEDWPARFGLDGSAYPTDQLIEESISYMFARYSQNPREYPKLTSHFERYLEKNIEQQQVERTLEKLRQASGGVVPKEVREQKRKPTSTFEPERIQMQLSFQRQMQDLADRYTKDPATVAVTRGGIPGTPGSQGRWIEWTSGRQSIDVVGPALRQPGERFEGTSVSQTFAHELFHWIVQNNVLSRDEWIVLKKVAKEKNWAAKIDQRVRVDTPEEVIAEVFADYVESPFSYPDRKGHFERFLPRDPLDNQGNALLGKMRKAFIERFEPGAPETDLNWPL